MGKFISDSYLIKDASDDRNKILFSGDPLIPYVDLLGLYLNPTSNVVNSKGFYAKDTWEVIPDNKHLIFSKPLTDKDLGIIYLSTEGSFPIQTPSLLDCLDNHLYEYSHLAFILALSFEKNLKYIEEDSLVAKINAVQHKFYTDASIGCYEDRALGFLLYLNAPDELSYVINNIKFGGNFKFEDLRSEEVIIHTELTRLLFALIRQTHKNSSEPFNSSAFISVIDRFLRGVEEEHQLSKALVAETLVDDWSYVTCLCAYLYEKARVNYSGNRSFETVSTFLHLQSITTELENNPDFRKTILKEV